MNNQEDKYLTEKKFKKFVNNDFAHLEDEVNLVHQKLEFLKGQIWFVIPVVLSVLGLVITLALKSE